MSLLARKKKLFGMVEPEDNQMPTVTAGTPSTGGSGLINVAGPIHAIGDLLVLVVATAESDEQITTPSGWTALGNAATGNDATADTSIQVFTRIATTTNGSGDYANTSDSGQFQCAAILAVHAPTSGAACEVDSSFFTDLGVTSASNAGWAGAATPVRQNTLGLFIVSNSTDSATDQMTVFNPQDWADGSPGILVQSNTVAGNGGGFSVAQAGLATAGTAQLPSGTLANSTRQCRASLLITEHL